MIFFTAECKSNGTCLKTHYGFQIRPLLIVQFFNIIRFYIIAVGRTDTLNKRIMKCVVRSFSQYGGDLASLVSQTTLSEFQEFDGLPRFGLWFFSLIVFCSSLKSLGFRR